MASFIPRFLRHLRDVVITAPSDGEALLYDISDGKWKNAAAGGSGDLSDAVILAPASSARNVIQPTAGDVIAAIVKAHAAQSVDLTQWQLADGTVLGSVGPSGAWFIAPSDDTLSSLVTLQAPVGFSANSPDGFLWQALTEDGTQTFVMDAYGGWQLVAPTGEGAAVVALQAEAADGAYSLNLASGAVSAALDYFINGTVPDGIVPATPRPVFYVYKTGGMWSNPTLATVPNWGVRDGGHESLGALAAIADGDVRTDERVQWYDSAIGAPLLRFKMRDAAGTLFTGFAYGSGGTDVALTDGGTGASTAAGARTALDVPSNAEAVLKTLFDANTLLVANANDTPLALTMGASTILARLAAGDTKAASVAEVSTLLSLGALATLSSVGSAQITNDSIVDADINSAAAIDYTKLALDSKVWPTAGAPIYAETMPQQTESGANNPGANSAQFSPFWLHERTTINRMTIKIVVQSGNIDVGIYDDDDTAGAPGTRLVSTGSIACPAAGIVVVTLGSTVLAPGRYWAAFVFDNGTATIQYGNYSWANPSIITRYSKATSFPLPASAVGSASADADLVYIQRPGGV